MGVIVGELHLRGVCNFHWRDDVLRRIDEVWNGYGHHKSFGGWYISTEISRKTKDCIQTFHEMGRMCKEISGGLPTFISPWIDGKKAVSAASSTPK